MGWTSTDLIRNRQTLTQRKARHVEEAIDYVAPVKASLLALEWHPCTFYAIIRLDYPDKPPHTFLRIDMIEQSPSYFAYKDMCESMGVYVDNPPSRSFAALIYKHIPVAPNDYAKEWRRRMNIKFDEQAAPQLALAL